MKLSDEFRTAHGFYLVNCNSETSRAPLIDFPSLVFAGNSITKQALPSKLGQNNVHRDANSRWILPQAVYETGSTEILMRLLRRFPDAER